MLRVPFHGPGFDRCESGASTVRIRRAMRGLPRSREFACRGGKTGPDRARPDIDRAAWAAPLRGFEPRLWEVPPAATHCWREHRLGLCVEREAPACLSQ